jgi:uncharacterized surface protein with fasciclin (FAS1) repeats
MFTPATNRRLIQATGLIDTLNQNTLPLTVLVPDNVAWQNAPRALLQNL